MAAITAIARTPFLYSIVQGPLWDKFHESNLTSVAFHAVLCPVGRAFIEKGKAGRHFRAVSRNGSVLVMSRTPLGELGDVRARIRISIWHRWHLRGERAKPWGVLLHVTPTADESAPGRLHGVIARKRICDAKLSVDLGGERVLNFVSD